MNIELGCYEPELSLKYIQEVTFLCLQHDITVLSLPINYLAQAKEFTNGQNTKLAAIIDYPYGQNPTETRCHMIIQAFRRGATVVELCLNMGMVNDDVYTNLRKDILSCKAVAESNKMNFRVVLEHRLFEFEQYYTVCEFLHRIGVPLIITSCGQILDEPEDNIINSYLISKKSKANILPASKLWQYKHLETALNAKMQTIRFLSLQTLKRCII